MVTTGTSPRTHKAVKFKSDPQQSTFRWECDMTNDGTNRVPQIEGYSKGMGFECTNKAELLIRKLQNPLGLYLQKTDEIRIYENLLELPSGQLIQRTKDSQPLILTMTRTGYLAHSWVKEAEAVLYHLQRLYDTLKNAAGSPLPRETGRRRNVWFDELNHANYTFKSLEELRTFCSSLVPTYGRPCMLKWWTAHLAIQPELAEPEAIGQSILQTPGLIPEQQATQNAVQGMLNRHTSPNSRR
ncbi:hypothetical protein ACAW74_18285 [Fibrella sp. WM1]|uniref:hypothetical protein n=1 Tax=Fibrella musci TaxID=3242485 RepID=UPI003522F11E